MNKLSNVKIGFFGFNIKPTSSKDPYGLRRMAISILRLLIENQKA